MLLARVWPVLLASACFVDPGNGGTSAAIATTTRDDSTTTTGGAPTTGTATTGGAADASSDAGTTVDPTATDPTTGPGLTTGTTDATSAADTDTTGAPNACNTATAVTFYVKDATLTGNVGPAQIDGEVVLEGESAGDGATWDITIPCTDKWFVWVRYYEEVGPNSYRFNIDDEAINLPFFDAGCDDDVPGGMQWQRLNRRGRFREACVGLEDPYLVPLTSGAHTFLLVFTGPQFLGDVIFTNDPDFTPP
ncbi:MAG: hypothetical protein JNL82_02635 [Myxococcales bacterium]|nr:hypothetical protein [Myxococcales bacterium]